MESHSPSISLSAAEILISWSVAVPSSVSTLTSSSATELLPSPPPFSSRTVTRKSKARIVSCRPVIKNFQMNRSRYFNKARSSQPTSSSETHFERLTFQIIFNEVQFTDNSNRCFLQIQESLTLDDLLIKQKIIVFNQNRTRKSSCVNARGIPPAV